MSDLLIITRAEWRKILEPFIRYKNDVAMPTALLTIEDINNQYQGKDLPEKIKRAIEAHRRLYGIKYVMLTGDSDRFPTRYVKAINTEWGTRWYPSDLYYSDLYDRNGNFDIWDSDHDGIYGEIDFGGGGDASTWNLDKIDMVPDIAVGRVPASTQDELATYLQKVMNYEFAASASYYHNYDSNWVKRALFVVDGGVGAFGDIGLSKQYAAPLANSGISVSYRAQNDPPWNTATPQQRADEINKVLNSGTGFLCYFGHGNTRSFSGWYDANNLVALNNQCHLPIVYAISCLTASFSFDLDTYGTVNGGDWTGGSGPRPEPAPIQPSKHDRDSMAEEFLVKRSSGAIAYIGTTDKIEHGGKNLAWYFFQAYQNMSKPPILGAMWKDALSRFARTDALKNEYYAFIHIHKVMLFGDPSLRVGGLSYPIIGIPGKAIKPQEMQAALE
jgi:hypothetical protein